MRGVAMKKWVGWVLGALLGLSLLGACSSSSNKNSDNGGTAGGGTGGSAGNAGNAGSGGTGGTGGDFGTGGTAGDGGTDPRVHSTTGQTWTILVYMLADNDLEPFALKDLTEMMSVPSSTSVNILAQVDRADGYTDDPIGGLPD